MEASPAPMAVAPALRALEILGINLDRLIVLPRLLGMLVSVPLLATCFCAAALWGGGRVHDRGRFGDRGGIQGDGEAHRFV